MNKDLDDRLIPNGEYRDAVNISVGKSEDEDIGALETVLGNKVMSDTNLGITGLEVIGSYTDKNNNRIYAFVTDFDDTTNLETGNPVVAPSTANCRIYYFTEPNDVTLLVSGSFLNFSKSSPITGISLIEELLFFTDNRNQPRKINVTNSATYYTEESQLSVAKYNPYEPISLVNKIQTTGLLTVGGKIIANVPVAAGVKPGMLFLSTTTANVDKIEATEFLYVISVTGTNVELNVNPSAGIIATDKLYFLSTTMTGQEISPFFDDVAMPGNTTWPGDPDYLETRYVRFSYRFEYDDGEYSIMAPFTQIAYIPKQKGYFLEGNEDEAFRSTVLEFMENGVQNVELLIPLPDTQANLGIETTSTYKIISIDVLYKEADSLAVKVLDRVPLNVAQQTSVDNIYKYDYLSAKPYRTLPENQTVRVFDKVPVTAHGQETAGNRIMYGNFKDKYTPPTSFNYRVGVGPKADTYKYNNWAEYPNHSVKQNRNYQVGFILADKFGRQSSVILSSVTEEVETINNIVFGGSTVYSPYNNSTESGTNPVKNWFGDALKVLFDSPGINQNENYQLGRPGLYANPRGNGFDVNGGNPIVTNTYNTPPTADVFTYTFIPVSTTNIPQLGDYLRGESKDFVEVSITPTVDAGGIYTVTCNGAINKAIYELSGSAGAQPKYAYELNSKGWYSYKVVVKQNEQDYYNVYLPGILDGYPDQDASATIPFPTGETGKTANIVLINDNINKIPRDLVEVGPEQKQFRSSVQLFGRVTNNTGATNIQYFPGIKTDTAISISTTADSNMVYDTLGVGGKLNIYQVDTKPLIARISTNVNLLQNPSGIGDVTASMRPFLAVYETEPIDSLLDIYWETASVGLIADLNADINSGFEGVSNFSSYVWTQPESLTLASPNILAANVQPINDNGLTITNTVLKNFTSSNPNITFVNNSATTGGYNFKITDEFVFLHNSPSQSFTLTMNVETTASSTAGGVAVDANLLSPELTITGSLTNTQPSFTIAGDITKLDNFTGTLVTYAGLNGSSDASANTQQLKWSIASVTPACSGCFSIGTTSGILSKDITTAAATYVLDIKLEDTYDGSNVANPGVESITKQQTVIVNSSVVGTPFQISNVGVFNSSCGAVGNPPTWNQNALVNTYYHTGGGTLPKAGDTIYSDSGGTTLAATGYYTINALPPDPPYNNSFQNNRQYITVNVQGSGAGVVDGAVPTDQPLFC